MQLDHGRAELHGGGGIISIICRHHIQVGLSKEEKYNPAYHKVYVCQFSCLCHT